MHHPATLRLLALLSLIPFTLARPYPPQDLTSANLMDTLDLTDENIGPDIKVAQSSLFIGHDIQAANGISERAAEPQPEPSPPASIDKTSSHSKLIQEYGDKGKRDDELRELGNCDSSGECEYLPDDKYSPSEFWQGAPTPSPTNERREAIGDSQEPSGTYAFQERDEILVCKQCNDEGCMDTKCPGAALLLTPSITGGYRYKKLLRMRGGGSIVGTHLNEIARSLGDERRHASPHEDRVIWSSTSSNPDSSKKRDDEQYCIECDKNGNCEAVDCNSTESIPETEVHERRQLKFVFEDEDLGKSRILNSIKRWVKAWKRNPRDTDAPEKRDDNPTVCLQCDDDGACIKIDCPTSHRHRKPPKSKIRRDEIGESEPKYWYQGGFRHEYAPPTDDDDGIKRRQPPPQSSGDSANSNLEKHVVVNGHCYRCDETWGCWEADCTETGRGSQMRRDEQDKKPNDGVVTRDGDDQGPRGPTFLDDHRPPRNTLYDELEDDSQGKGKERRKWDLTLNWG